MFICQLNNFHTEPAATAEALTDALAATGQVVLTEAGRPALIARSGRLQVLSGEPIEFVEPLLHAELVQLSDRRMGDRRECARLVKVALTGEPGRAALPVVRASSRLPCFIRRDDCLIMPQPGFSTADGAYYAPSLLPLAAMPAADPAYPHLHKLFAGPIFAESFHRANLLGALIASFARPAIAEFPLLLLEANAKSAGKTATAQAFGQVLTGEPTVSMTFSGSEDFMESKLGYLALSAGPSYVFIDNVRPKRSASRAIRSQFLSAAATGHSAGVRALYKGTVPIFDPIVVMTMNHARVEQDLADKTVRFPLRLPDGMTHRKLVPFPPDYAARYRISLVAEIMSILSALDLSSFSGPFHTRFYDFERIAILAARALGLEACFDPARCGTADAVLIELAGIIADRHIFPTRSALAARVVEVAEGSNHCQELRDMLLNYPHSSRQARAAALCVDLERHFPNRDVDIAGEAGRIALDKDAEGVYTISFVRNS